MISDNYSFNDVLTRHSTALLFVAFVVLLILLRIYNGYRRLRNFTHPNLKYEFVKSQIEISKPIRTVLVSGGNGFLGRHLVSSLLTEYKCSIAVIVFDIVIPDMKSRNPYVSYCKGNLLRLDHLHRLFSAVTIQSVFHCANLLPFLDIPKQALRTVNINGTSNIFEISRLYGVRSFIFTSSATVVLSKSKRNAFRLTEDSPYPIDHIDSYSETKEISERMITSRSNINGMVSCVLRPVGIFGIGDKIISDDFKRGVKNFIIDMDVKIDWVSVESAAYGHILAEKALQDRKKRSLMNGQVCNIGSDEEHTYRWFFGGDAKDSISHWGHKPPTKIPYWVAMILTALNEIGYVLTGMIFLSPNLTFALVDYGARSFTFSSKKAYGHFDYKPLTTVSESIKKLVDDYKASQS